MPDLTPNLPDGSSKEELRHFKSLAVNCYYNFVLILRWNKIYGLDQFSSFCEKIHRFTPFLCYPIGTLLHLFDNTLPCAPFKVQMCPFNKNSLSLYRSSLSTKISRKVSAPTNHLRTNITGTCNQIFEDKIQLMDHFLSNQETCIYHCFLHLFNANILESLSLQPVYI